MWSNIIPILKKGIEKWNSVYFRDGGVDKRLVYIEETNVLSDANIVFYPSVAKTPYDTSDLDYSVIQNTAYPGTTEVIEESCEDGYSSTFSGVEFKHCTKFNITINVREIVKPSASNSILMGKIEKIGTHEIGHVLGLGDIENVRAQDYANGAHSGLRPDLIMSGYYDENYTLDLSYKEIAGVAIFRGIHTDMDHQWLKEIVNNSIRYKCLICNGTTMVEPSGTIIDYGHNGENNHSHIDSDLLIVGKIQYMKYDNHAHYYKKCKYCSYVSVVSDNITYKNVTNNFHTVECNDCNMEWQQEHTYVYDNTNKDIHTSKCQVCNYIGTQSMHIYSWIYIDENKHLNSCIVCDYSSEHIHEYIYDEGLNKNVCVNCGYAK